MTRPHRTDEAVDGEENKILRVKVTYSDRHGEDKVVYAWTTVTVRGVPEETNTAPTNPDDPGARTVNENSKIGQHVGNPVTEILDEEDQSLLTYTLTNPTPGVGNEDDDFFKIDGKTGQITVAMAGLQADPPNAVLSYTVMITARDPDGADNSSTPFDVVITVKQVNEAPKVRQANEEVIDDPLLDSDDEISTVCIEEKRALAFDATTTDEEEDESRLANVLTNNNNCEVSTGNYTYRAEDDDVETLKVITGTSRPGDDEVKLSLTGDDAAHFELVEVTDQGVDLAEADEATGRFQLRFKKSEADFEAPADANKDNRYEVSVKAEDEDSLTSMKDLTVKVVNMAEKGKVELSTDQPAVGFPLTATLKDPDTGETGLKWQWMSSLDGNRFADIIGATSDTYTPKAATEDDPATTLIDEEDPGDEGRFLLAMVTYRDDALADDDPDAMADVESANAVRVEPDVNSDPVFDAGITREVAENTPTDGTVGGPVTATDPDDDALTYSITGGADMAAFKIDSGTGQIKVGKGTKLNFESSQTTYMVEVTATDPFGGTGSIMVTIMVTDMNEGPTLTLGPGSTPPSEGVVGGRGTVSVQEGTTTVWTYTTTITSPTWALSGADADDFSISGGVLEFTSPPDYEAPTDANTDNVYMVTVMANNGNGDAERDVYVTVTNDTSDDATTPGAFDALAEYDGDNDGSINKDEVFTAIDDYFDTLITKEQVFMVIDLYFE